MPKEVSIGTVEPGDAVNGMLYAAACHLPIVSGFVIRLQGLNATRYRGIQIQPMQYPSHQRDGEATELKFRRFLLMLSEVIISRVQLPLRPDGQHLLKPSVHISEEFIRL